ncbi:MAG: hypothetical protein GF320_07325 [Armatimonadia bacterium]|nr:hypothetical protein [Armatimonadia bacterium]
MTRLVAILSLCGATLAAAAMARTPDPLDVLRKAAYHQDDIPHRGSAVTVVTPPDKDEIRVPREVYAGRRGRYDIRVDSPPPIPPHRIVCDGQRQWRVMGDNDVAFVSAPLDFEEERRERMDRVDKLEEWARASIQRSTLCNRGTWLIKLERRGRGDDDRWYPMRDLHIDRETYLELGNTTYGRHGKPVSRTRYEALAYLGDDEVDDSRLQYGPEDHTLILPDPHRMGWPGRYRDATKHADWLVPLRERPAEWQPAGVAVHRYGRQAVAQFLYLDKERRQGTPVPILLFEKPRGEEAPHLDEFYALDDVTTQPQRRRQAVAWTDGELVYILASAMPRDELLRAAWRHVQAGDER